jgi:hypothetical protein
MRRVSISVISGLAMLVAQVPPGFAQNAVSTPAQPAAFGPAQEVSPPAIVAAFKAFPKGGDLLSKRIEDIIVADPKLAPDLAKYVQTAPDLNKDQKLAALRGLAAALNRLGIKAAELPVYTKEAPPPVAPVYGEVPLLPLLGLAAIAGLACVFACQGQSSEIVATPVPVSP